MHALITGMAGFAGQYLAEHLLRETDWTLVGITRGKIPSLDSLRSPRVIWRQLDLLDGAGVQQLVREFQPQQIAHLASQSHVPTSWERPWETYESNLRGQLHLFSAVIDAGISPRMLIVSSNEVYGAVPEAELPIKEERKLQPNNPYAVSKVAQDLMAVQYVLSHHLDVVVARPFNHVGPRQDTRFVIPRLAEQVAEIEAGIRPPEMQLGNMAAQRDFTDVRDVVRAYRLLLQSGVAGQVYNVCNGVPRSIQFALDTLQAIANVKIDQISDPSKFRKIDTPISYGDASRLRAATGWVPEFSFEQTVRDVLDEARRKVKERSQQA
jgi:GDP-4-dehydro-6-deoxy-D-mannose reductase